MAFMQTVMATLGQIAAFVAVHLHLWQYGLSAGRSDANMYLDKRKSLTWGLMIMTIYISIVNILVIVGCRRYTSSS